MVPWPPNLQLEIRSCTWFTLDDSDTNERNWFSTIQIEQNFWTNEADLKKKFRGQMNLEKIHQLLNIHDGDDLEGNP